MWNESGPQGDETRKIRHLAVNYTLGKGLDIGCGITKLHHNAVGVDLEVIDGRRVGDLNIDGTKLSIISDNSQDFVYSSHFLEHTVNPKEVLAEWWRVIKPGGNLVLYLPHANFYPRMGTRLGANPDHKHDFLPQDIIRMVREIALDAGAGATLLEDEERCGGDGMDEYSEYSFFQVYQKRDDGQFTLDLWQRQPKSLLVIRYGGYGDGIMSASILPQLKRQGWHITWNTTPQQKQVLEKDPHIDAFWLQDKDVIPNEWLGGYWERLSKRYDRVINLCESVEGDLLVPPGSISYTRNKRILHGMCNKNYGEHTHWLADLDYQPNQRFYFDKDEIIQIKSDGRPVVVWQVGGSAWHKIWPYVHNGIVMGLYRTDAHFVICGGDTDREIVELIRRAVARMHGGMDRVTYLAGEASIREACALACVSDVVVGPETGVLNACAMVDGVSKIVMLSHSSEENLTKHWVRTRSLVPKAHCHPCHRLHYGQKGLPGWQGTCPEDEESGGALCTGFLPAEVIDVLCEVLAERKSSARAKLTIIEDDEEVA